MQKHFDISEFTPITPTAPISVGAHGGRAKCLQRLIRLDLPVPRTVALSFSAVRSIAAGQDPDTAALLAEFGEGPLISVRPSSEDPDWGGPGAILNIGMNDAQHKTLAHKLGQPAADALYLRFIQAYAVHVARLDPDMFELPQTSDRSAIDMMLHDFESEMEEPFPQDPARQLADVLRSMARAWEGPSARLLRQGKGAPADAGLGLVVQEMAIGVGNSGIGECGSGVIQFVDGDTGLPQITGRYLSQSQGREALVAEEGAIYLTRDGRGPSLEELCPEVFEDLKRYGDLSRARLREEMQIEFTIEAGNLYVLDAVRVARTARAGVRIAVALAASGIIPEAEAVLRVEPRALSELLHRQVDPADRRTAVIARGIAASPGAATGRLVFSSRAAQTAAAREEPCILVRRETTPGDVRGMHASVGVLTEKGGVTSHAAVIARGLGLPCVVGASSLAIDRRKRTLTAEDGRIFHEGDTVTLDGTTGVVREGAARLLEPALDDAFRTLLSWADELRDIGVRANADTPAEAKVARAFDAEGIGLCRTEHMFFDENRLSVMREMIFTDSPEDRAAALDRLLPMQRADFRELFEIMRGLPVCIRLLDPPLHEFLPQSRDGLHDLAEALDLPVSKVTARVEALSEFNPMLGMRGVRLGIAVPEIYDMQARAIFEATVEAGQSVTPEVMLPLVSARREVELVKARIDAVAAAVKAETGADFDYRLGVMVETPRAALRAEEIAPHSAFLSFGTNDLTQMTYGLSRDDAGRFMGAYVSQGVFVEDPFLRLDVEGVGELLTVGAERGRRGHPDIVLSVCGEHGGDPDSIAFCRAAGFDYVSCSPFRVPLARLAAAQLAIRDHALIR
ncbi:putative PEP-binding protein [Tranquillimonas alkanivorans]|uniref:Pyruvate, phosphate dikinase n=1 Tax=Tranquillimonas alkanivorans TaxID=441119 RepID=A0A1I5KJL6_9RHOB|nr:putative PEP-binding protein [Tranquillimonas alkanivorans]SFO85280.1 pyruvate, orthophosphate dikinase [Tranquillimonas alkanivorans]